MVCFQGGRPHKDHYRRFKIRAVAGIDDFLSMKEVVGRRYRRLAAEGAPLPDLVVVDGGKGQLAFGHAALADAGVKIPIASLAKRLEEVYLPGRPQPVLLSATAPPCACSNNCATKPTVDHLSPPPPKQNLFS